jgi:hypothetical protein
MDTDKRIRRYMKFSPLFGEGQDKILKVPIYIPIV